MMHLIRLALGSLSLLLPCAALAQTIDDRNVSEHVRLRLPMERQWLGRELILDLERCWRYMNSTPGIRLPRRILVDAVWDREGAQVDPAGRIIIGMNTPAAAYDAKAYLLHAAARETARLGLLDLPRGATIREESEFLIEGMAEIAAREFLGAARGLAGAWIHAQMLDRMNPLSFAALASWSGFAGDRHSLREAAPGATFILACRELHGRERTVKFIEALRRSGLMESITSTFNTAPAVLEETWLKKLRAYSIAEIAQPFAGEEAPRLERASCIPLSDRDGARMQLRLLPGKGANALLPQGLFLLDEVTGKVFQPRLPVARDVNYIPIEIPVDAAKIPALFNYRVIAVDESGNVADWRGSCTVQPPRN